MSNSLWPHGLQHTRPPCPSPTPRVYSDSCSLSQWCPPNISSSVVPFSCLQSFPESGSFSVSQLFESGGQSIGASASASVLPMNIQHWFPLGWTGLISLQGVGSDINRKRSFKRICRGPLYFFNMVQAGYYCKRNLWAVFSTKHHYHYDLEQCYFNKRIRIQFDSLSLFFGVGELHSEWVQNKLVIRGKKGASGPLMVWVESWIFKLGLYNPSPLHLDHYPRGSLGINLFMPEQP